jgi:hypothetical protein
MALRYHHYDLAFEAFLRDCRLPYVAVDEKRRALLHSASLKSMDFIVYANEGPNWLVDVKGRRFDETGKSSHRWENWATADDLRSLAAWETVFGSGFRSLLVFAYDLGPAVELAASRVQPADRPDGSQAFTFREKRYSFYGVWGRDYREAMKRRSASWDTVWVPAATYRELRFPITRTSIEAIGSQPQQDLITTTVSASGYHDQLAPAS